jgi:hypothetical protein
MKWMCRAAEWSTESARTVRREGHVFNPPSRKCAWHWNYHCNHTVIKQQYTYMFIRILDINDLLDIFSTSHQVKCKATPAQAWTGPEVSTRLRLPELIDSRHMNVAKFPALRTGHFTPPPKEMFLVLPRAIVRLKGLVQWKIPMTPSGIKPAIFRLVAHSLKQPSHCVPPHVSSGFIFILYTFTMPQEYSRNSSLTRRQCGLFEFYMNFELI